MVKHIIIWKINDTYDKTKKAEVARTVKEKLEGLHGKIDGLCEIRVNIAELETSNGDIMLDSTFSDEESYKSYITHPLHVEAATYVRQNVIQRMCVDYNV